MWQNHSAEGKPAASVPSGLEGRLDGPHRDHDSDQPTEKAGGKSQEH